MHTSHAWAREEIFQEVPLMYQTTEEQAKHYNYIANAYEKRDEAHARADFHHRYASSRLVTPNTSLAALITDAEQPRRRWSPRLLQQKRPQDFHAVR